MDIIEITLSAEDFRLLESGGDVLVLTMEGHKLRIKRGDRPRIERRTV